MEPGAELRVETREGAQAILRDARRIAVLGIKPESKADQAAYYVPEYLQSAGYAVVPVPVYFPEATSILGEPVYRTLAAVPGDLDLVIVFRRPGDIPPHVDDILAKRPRAVWLQSGIRNEAVADRLAAAGIAVVQDRCAMVEHRFMG